MLYYSDQRVGRAAAILTTSDVATTEVAIGQTVDAKVMVYANFTKGSLTNVIITPQVLRPGSATWHDVTTPGALTLTADGDKAFMVDCAGAARFRCVAKGTGTVTSSSLTINFGWHKPGGLAG